MLVASFGPTNPHRGDAIVATFFWSGSTTRITSVTDRLSDGTSVGNAYALVDSISAGGVSMATFAATNVGNFLDPNPPGEKVLLVQATLSDSVPDGGVMVSAWSGVEGVSTQALGMRRSASGSGSTSPTVASAGSITANAGALVYGVTMANRLAGRSGPTGFSNITSMSDAAGLVAGGDYVVAAGAGSFDPQWGWGFNQPTTWLATVLSLNAASPAPTPSGAPATRVVFTVQPSTTTAGSSIAPPVKVAAQDSVGTTDTTFRGTITVDIGTNPGAGTLSGTRSVAAVNGVATFSNLSINQPGNGYTLQATAVGLTPGTSAPFNITAPPPPPPPPPPPQGSGITLDRQNGLLGSVPAPGITIIKKGFNPVNPHRGDAIVATFFWAGASTITGVSDHETNGKLVGNTYRLVESLSAGGLTMATYVATNAQNFPDAFDERVTLGDSVLVVEASFSSPVTRGGVMISAWVGVDAVSSFRSLRERSCTGSC